MNVALATAAGGEDAVAQDWLSYLRTVGSGFSSLIYDLENTSGFEELKTSCKPLWEALEKSENDLPDRLVLLTTYYLLCCAV